MTHTQKREWRKIVAELVSTFKLQKHPPQPVEEFRAKVSDNPLAIIYEDRGPQITLEVINGYNMNSAQRAQVLAVLPHLEEIIDLREPMLAWAAKQFEDRGVPVTPRLGGVFALDLALANVSKTESVDRILNSKKILGHLGLNRTDLSNPEALEVWGDRFDETRGTDWRISAALDPRVRSIDFRREDPQYFLNGYNIVIWNGEYELHDGALEYLRSRHS